MKTKSEKPAIVESLARQIKEAKSVTVLNYQGMPNKALGELRNGIRTSGGFFLVAKNTLVKRALELAGMKADSTAEEGLNGPTAVVFANTDEITPLQLIGKSIKESEFPKLKFGVFGSQFIDATRLLILANLPNKNVLQAQLLGSLSAPKYNMVGVLKGNLTKLIYILDQRSKQIAS